MSTTGNVVGFVVAVAVAALVRQSFVHKNAPSAADMETHEYTAAEVDKQLTDAAERLNQSTPKKIDSQTVLDSVGTGNKEIRFNFSLPHIPASQIAPEVVSKLRNAQVEQVCGAKEMRPLFKNGVTVVYTYMGSDGGFVTDLHITPTDCRI